MTEISDTTLRRDQAIKLPQYARAGIPESWIVDLTGEAIEHHNDPVGNGYRRMERAGRGPSLTSEILPDLILPVEAVLG